MATKSFECESCGNSGKITIKESEYVKLSDLVCCPFCGSDIFEEETFEEEDLDD